MQNAPARKMLDDLFHALRVKRPEDVKAVIGTNEDVNGRTINRPFRRDFIRNLGLDQMIVFGDLPVRPDRETNKNQGETSECENILLHSIWCNRPNV